MKVIFVISESHLWKPKLLEELYANSGKSYEIDSVFITDFKSYKVKFRRHVKRYYYLLGIKQFIIQGLFSLYCAVYNKIDKYFNFRKTYSVEMVCRKKCIKYYKVKDINDESVLRNLKQLKPDLIINLGNQIYSEELLNIPKYGCINKHCSLLPAYQGVYPVWWALLNNEKEIGVTVYFMNREIDKGEVILQKKIEVLSQDSFFSLYDKCFGLSCQIIMETIEKIKSGEFEHVLTNYHPSYFSYPSKRDSELFFKASKKIK